MHFRKLLIASLLLCGTPALAEEPAMQIALPEPTGPAPLKCEVVQGQEVPTRQAKLRRSFVENFDSLDLSFDDKGSGWRTHFPFSRRDHWMSRTLPGNNEQQLYIDQRYRPAGHRAPRNPFSVADGILSITAKKEPQPLGPFSDPRFGTRTFPYTSGILSSYGKFSQRYGYFEIRAKLPLDTATWSGFWMLRADKVQWPPEIDVIEINNRAPKMPAGQGANALHSKAGGTYRANGCYVDTPEADQDFHTYGVLWTAEQITYYVDRVPVTVTATPEDLHDPMYLLLQLAIGPNADASTPDTTTLQADWIAAYAIE